MHPHSVNASSIYSIIIILRISIYFWQCDAHLLTVSIIAAGAIDMCADSSIVNVLCTFRIATCLSFSNLQSIMCQW